MATQRAVANGNIGILGAVFIVFLVLKLCDKIDWSWWWVTCPLWAVPVGLCAVAVIALVIWGVVSGIGWLVRN